MKGTSNYKGRKGFTRVVTACAALLIVASAAAQEPQVPKVMPVPPLPPPSRTAPQPPPEPAQPPPQAVEDARAHVRFHLPAGWNVSRNDGEISTFHLDARTAPGKSQLRAVASLGFNPYPRSTFSGAIFYLSLVPHSSAAACAAETATRPDKPLPPELVGDVKFSRGEDEHGRICTESRDIVYTAMRGGSCVRFDLAVNSFCGGEVSGAQDLTEAQLGSLFKRLRDILQTVEFTGK